MKEYIRKIVELGKPEDMDCLSDMLVELLNYARENNSVDYKKYKSKLKGMAYDYQVDEELGHEIVEKMQPLGEYWSLDTIKSVVTNDNHRIIDMYVVMNSLVNDYRDVINPEDAGVYIRLADAWIDDIDAKEHKIWWYFVK